MNISNIKSYVISNMNKKLNFKYSGNRGFNEKFSGIITDTFAGIFLIKSTSDNRIRSFSYSDVLIGNLEIV